jgi:hypothetical protein
VLKTDDPEDREGYYTFSDGCGNISLALSKLINERLGLYQCSAYQVRLGGAKGVLVVKPSLGEEQHAVQLRQSQIKFKTKDIFLEVVRGATFTQGYLNRQVILLLSCLGMKDEIFLNHLERALNSLDISAVLNNLEKIFKKSKKSKKSRAELAQELELFFGPSKIFGSIFKYAMVRSFELKSEKSIEKKKELLRPLIDKDEIEEIGAGSTSLSNID